MTTSQSRARFVLTLPFFAGIALPRSGLSSQTLDKIRVVGPISDDYKCVWYGARAGTFRKYGLDVQPSLIGTGSAAVAAVVGGAAEIAHTNILTVLQAHDHGVPLQMVAPGALYLSDKPWSSVLVLKDSPIRRARDLNGASIGALGMGDTLSTSVLAWIDQDGGDSRTVKIVEERGSAMLAALDQGRVTAAVTLEPVLSQALETGRVRVLGKSMDAISKRFQSGVFVSTDAQPEGVMNRFAKAMQEAQRYTNTHFAETVELVATYSGVTPDVVMRSVRNVDPDFLETKAIQPVIDLFAKYGLISKAFPASEVISSAALRP